MRKLIYIVTAVLGLAVLSSCGVHKELVILHVNDTHSRLDPEKDGNGGVIERAVFVDSVRRADGAKNVLLLHGGDFNQGSSYFNILGGDLEVALVNALGYDCITLGNHEFDNGIEDLARRAAMINCPIVCCNYDFSPFELGEYVKPYAIVKKAGKKIGIIGINCNIRTVVAWETASRIPEFDTVEMINKYAELLHNEEKCDIIILLSHAGYGADCQLVTKTRYIDAVVGGHSHTHLDQEYKAVDLDGKTVPVVQDGRWGLEVGVLRFKL